MARPAQWRVTFTREFLVNGALSPAERSIILALAGWADMTLHADPTKAQLAAASGVCERQLWEHLQTLRAGGYVEWTETRIGGHRRNVYHLLPPCGICMMARGRATMQFPHGSLIEKRTQKLPMGVNAVERNGAHAPVAPDA